MTPFSIASSSVRFLTVTTVLVGAWSARTERVKLLALAKRYGITVHDSWTDADIEQAISRRFSGWVSR